MLFSRYINRTSAIGKNLQNSSKIKKWWLKWLKKFFYNFPLPASYAFDVFCLIFTIFLIIYFYPFHCNDSLCTQHLCRLLYNFDLNFYQISTLSTSILNILLPSLTSNASQKSCMFDRGWLHLNSFGPCGSKVTSWRALSFLTNIKY